MFAALTALLVGCQYSESRQMKRRVYSTELVGTWTVDQTGVTGLEYVGAKPSPLIKRQSIELRANSTCHVLAFFAASRDAIGPFIDTECTWRLGNEGGTNRRQAAFIELRERPAEGIQTRTMKIDEEEGHLVMWDYITDPDAWKYLQFAKTSQRPNIPTSQPARRSRAQ